MHDTGHLDWCLVGAQHTTVQRHIWRRLVLVAWDPLHGDFYSIQCSDGVTCLYDILNSNILLLALLTVSLKRLQYTLDLFRCYSLKKWRRDSLISSIQQKSLGFGFLRFWLGAGEGMVLSSGNNHVP